MAKMNKDYQRMIDAERERFRKKLREKTHDKFISDWASMITAIYGYDNIKKAMEHSSFKPSNELE